MTTAWASQPSETALVGATGLVGGTLSRQREFDVRVASRSAGQLAGRHFDEVVFCAARAEKWRANAQPHVDREHVDDLCRLLDSFRTERLVLISTVDVFAVPVGVDETSPVDPDGLAPYGVHRRLLEEHALASCAQTRVVRLPGLFGRGLKKNVVFDLLHAKAVDRIDHRSRYQYYDLSRLGDDLDRARDRDLELIHLVTEPVETRVVARAVFGLDLDHVVEGVHPAVYDVRTRHAELFDSTGPYLQGAASVLGRMRDFVAGERGDAL